jgi:PAS domain S-box-containing protein
LVNSGRAAPIPLEETLAKINVPSLISNRDGLVTWQNEAASNTLGDLRGKAFTDIVAPEYVPTVRRQLARKLRGVPVTDYEVEIFTPDGRRRQVEISSVPIRGGDDCQAVFGVVLPARQPVKQGKVELTPRQREVLGYLAAGASTADIAFCFAHQQGDRPESRSPIAARPWRALSLGGCCSRTQPGHALD